MLTVLDSKDIVNVWVIKSGTDRLAITTCTGLGSVAYLMRSRMNKVGGLAGHTPPDRNALLTFFRCVK
jgi:hypothetical protein